MQQPVTGTSVDSPAVVILATSSVLISPFEQLVRGARVGDVLVRPDLILPPATGEVMREFDDKKLRFAEVDFRPLLFGRVDLFANQLAELTKSCRGSVRLLRPKVWSMLPRQRLEQFAQIISESCGAKTVVI